MTCSGCGLFRCEGECYDDPIEEKSCGGCGRWITGSEKLCLFCARAEAKVAEELRFTMELRKDKAA